PSVLGSPSTVMRSRTVSRCGLVYRPVRNPCARNNESIMRAADVLPLVPVRCTDGYARCGLPIKSSSASMRLRSATIRPAPRSSSSRSTRANSESTHGVYGGGTERPRRRGRHSVSAFATLKPPSQETPMTQPPGTPPASDPYADDPGRYQQYGQPAPGQWSGEGGAPQQPGGGYPGGQYPGQQPGGAYPGQQPGGDATTPMPPTQPQ